MPLVPRKVNLYFPPLDPAKRTGLRKVADRLLRILGPSWRAAPLRRGLQIASLATSFYLFFYVSWPYAENFRGMLVAEKEWLPIESLLSIDPLVGLSTAIAARAINVALIGTVAVLAACLLVPRGFCGYVCPLGTLIDLFDWLVGGHFRKRRKKRCLPTHNAATADVANKSGFSLFSLKYFILTTVLVAAVFGVVLSGFVSAIPVVTRAMAFTLGTLQLGWMRNWTQVREFGSADWLSIGLFLFILLAGVVRRRFWCRYLCPSGALFSLLSWLRLSQREVNADCKECGKCAKVCPFDAVAEDYGTRPHDCAWCQTCGGVCPTGAVQFVGRFSGNSMRRPVNTAAARRIASRRGFVFASVSGFATAMGIRRHAPAVPGDVQLIRPPGSVPEPIFLDLCVPCGQCFQACPGPVLQPAGWDAPLEALWTPVAVMAHAGCHQECNFCTQVCPTGAIRPLSLEEKKTTSMGLAVIDTKTCLPHAGLQDCRLCIDECDAAGYRAIELRRIKLPMGDIPEGVFSDMELEEMSRIDAPFINADACVGCGLCEYRCHAALVKQQKSLTQSAIRVVAENADR